MSMSTLSSSSIIHHGLCLCYFCTTSSAAVTTTATLSSPVAARNHEIRNLQEQQSPFVNLYTPTTNVDDPARIDLDIQKVYTQSLLGTSADVNLAKDVYTGTAGYASSISLESMGTIPKESVMFPNINYAYSGVYDYGDQLMKSTFNGQSTNFPFLDGGGGGGSASPDFDFSKLNAEGRAAFFRWGILGNVMNYVTYKLRHATKVCHEGTADLSISMTHWDEAVAFYIGSITRESGTDGYLLYTLAQKESQRFGTYDDTLCKANVNEEIIGDFIEGRAKLQQNLCDIAESFVDRIQSKMLVPFVQGLLRHTYAIHNQNDSQQVTQGEVAGFAAALLPTFNYCDQSVALIVAKDLAPGKALQSSFEVIKYNVERTYTCLRISCNDVGGLLNTAGNNYLRNAEPCNYVRPESTTEKVQDVFGDISNDVKTMNPTARIILFVALGLFIVGCGLFTLRCMGCCCWRKANPNPKKRGEGFVEEETNDLELTSKDPSSEEETNEQAPAKDKEIV